MANSSGVQKGKAHDHLSRNGPCSLSGKQAVHRAILRTSYVATLGLEHDADVLPVGAFYGEMVQ